MCLAERLKNDTKRKVVSFPVSVRLRPDVDCLLQQVVDEFPHLNTSQIINEALHESLGNVLKTIQEQ